MSATDRTRAPAGTHGGPVVQTHRNPIAEYGKLSWETMPERLLAAGVSWKVYNDLLGLIGLNVLPFFKAYHNPFSVTGFELVSKALPPSYPSSFAADVKAGTLPSVHVGIPYPLPKTNAMPSQETTPNRPPVPS